MADNTIKIGGELESMATGKIVAAASAILDKLKNKTQELVNQENTSGIQTNAENIANLNAVVASLQQLIDAATITGGTVANAAEVFVAAIAGLNANNVQSALETLNSRTTFPMTKPNPNTNVTEASEIGYGGISVACGLIYDISVANAVNNVPAQYESLSAALGTNGANIPQDIRRGGMAVKFINSSSGKYEQYRLMSDTFNTTPANWQGVDDVPVAGSKNLVKSGGAYPIISISNLLGYTTIEKLDTTLSHKEINPSWMDSGVKLNYDFQIISNAQNPITAYFGKHKIGVEVGGIEAVISLLSVDANGHASGSVIIPEIDWSTYDVVIAINNGRLTKWTVTVKKDALINERFDEVNSEFSAVRNEIQVVDNTYASYMDHLRCFCVKKTDNNTTYKVVSPIWIKNGVYVEYDIQLTDSPIPSTMGTAYFGRRNKTSGTIQSVLTFVTFDSAGHASGSFIITDLTSDFEMVFSINKGNSLTWNLFIKDGEQDKILEEIPALKESCLKFDAQQKSYVRKLKSFILAQEGNDEYGQATILFDGDSIFGSQLEAVTAISGNENEQPYNLNRQTCARKFYDKYQWNNNIKFRRIDHSDWIKSGTWSAWTISSTTNPNAGSYNFNNVKTYKASATNDYTQITVDGYEHFKLVWSNYGSQYWRLRVDVSIDNGNTFVTPSSLGIGENIITHSSEHQENYDCYCYNLDSSITYIFRLTVESNASQVRLYGCEMWNGTRLNVIVEAASGTTAKMHIDNGLTTYLSYSKFKPLLYVWDILYYNDNSYMYRTNYTFKQYSDSIMEIVDILAENNIPVVGTTPHGHLTAITEQRDITDWQVEVQNFMRNKMGFVDIYKYFVDNNLNLGLYTSDGTHLNDAGNTVYFNLLDALFD